MEESCPKQQNHYFLQKINCFEHGFFFAYLSHFVTVQPMTLRQATNRLQKQLLSEGLRGIPLMVRFTHHADHG